VLRLVGLTEGRIDCRFRCYEGTSVNEKLGETDLDVHGVNVFARKPL
jgi:hypothetical protein